MGLSGGRFQKREKDWPVRTADIFLRSGARYMDAQQVTIRDNGWVDLIPALHKNQISIPSANIICVEWKRSGDDDQH